MKPLLMTLALCIAFLANLAWANPSRRAQVYDVGIRCESGEQVRFPIESFPPRFVHRIGVEGAEAFAVQGPNSYRASLRYPFEYEDDFIEGYAPPCGAGDALIVELRRSTAALESM